MGEPQIIRTPNGDEMVVVPRAEYEALRAAAEDALLDAEDLAITQSRWQELNASGRLVTPPDVANSILEGSPAEAGPPAAPVSAPGSPAAAARRCW